LGICRPSAFPQHQLEWRLSASPATPSRLFLPVADLGWADPPRVESDSARCVLWRPVSRFGAWDLDQSSLAALMGSGSNVTSVNHSATMASAPDPRAPLVVESCGLHP